MRDHLMLVRVRTDDSFMPAREAVRSAIDGSPECCDGQFRLISISPIPRDRVVKKRRPPVRRDYPLLDFMERAPG